MSEFKIIKCKKCDAPLVELAGDKIRQCMQCGYKFTSGSQTTNKHSHGNFESLQTSSGNNDFLTKLNQLKAQIATKTKATKAKEKLTIKKKPIWVTLVKWYFIIVFSIGVLSQCFNR